MANRRREVDKEKEGEKERLKCKESNRYADIF